MKKYAIEVEKILHACFETADAMTGGTLNSMILFISLLGTQKFKEALEKSTPFKLESVGEAVVVHTTREIKDEARKIPDSDFETIINSLVENPRIAASGMEYYFSRNFTRIIFESFQFSKLLKRSTVDTDCLVSAFLNNTNSDLKNFYKDAMINIEVLQKEFFKIEDKKPDHVLYIPQSLIGIIEVLNSKYAGNSKSEILGREAECSDIWTKFLKKTKRNIILIGKPGVGKSAIIQRLVCDILNKECPKEFQDFAIVSLNISGLIAGTMYRGQAEQRYRDVEEFLNSNEKVILFIDEIHMIVGAGATGARDNNDFSNSLKPLLAGDTARIIGATTPEEYERCFAGEGALRRRFHKINVKEPKMSEVYNMLKVSIENLEKYHNVKISEDMVNLIIRNAACFNYDTCNPDRTKDLIDLSMATAQKDNKAEVDEESVLKNFDINFRSFKKMSEFQLKSTAYHEAGHYLVWRFSKKLVDRDIIIVSIMPTDTYQGINVFEYTDNTPDSDMGYYVDDIAMTLAGRVAEKMFTSTYSSGASSDLSVATTMAYDVITRYGMGERIANRVIINNESYHMQNEKITDTINEEVEKLIKKAYSKAEEVLNENSKKLEMIVEKLVKKGIVGKDELEEIVNEKFS